MYSKSTTHSFSRRRHSFMCLFIHHSTSQGLKAHKHPRRVREEVVCVSPYSTSWIIRPHSTASGRSRHSTRTHLNPTHPFINQSVNQSTVSFHGLFPSNQQLFKVPVLALVLLVGKISRYAVCTRIPALGSSSPTSEQEQPPHGGEPRARTT